MAEDKKDKQDKKKVSKVGVKRANKKTQTVRERTKTNDTPKKERRIRKTVGNKVKAPAKGLSKLHKKVVNIPLPDNRFGRIMGKRIKIFPQFLVNAFKEIKLVVWPTPRQTVSLTIAVFIFAVIFASIVGLLDFGFSKLFEKYIIK